MVKTSFFGRLKQKVFDDSVNWEIFNRIGAHLRGEKDCGYHFTTDDEMDAQTGELDAHIILDTIEARIRNMPRFYGKAFRHILHRDLHERLRFYEEVARHNEEHTSSIPRQLYPAKRLALSQ